MKDVQNHENEIKLRLNVVGVKEIVYPLTLVDKKHKEQNTVAKISLFVDLPEDKKGTHMSRFIEILNDHKTIYLDSRDWDLILDKMIKKFGCKRAHFNLSAPYFIQKRAPVSKKMSLMKVDVRFLCTRSHEKKQKIMEIKVPVTSLCPCSKEISKYGAHNQRSYVTAQLIFKEFIWIEDIVELIEGEASSPIYPLLKREDEKHVTEKAYEKPVFAEDLVRRISKGLMENTKITWFYVEVENQESIHDHNAFASFEWGKKELL